MLKKFQFPMILFIPVAALQLGIVPLISIDNIIPDLLVILLVYFSIKYGQIYGTVLGFLFGFLYDMISGGLIGSLMFSMTLAGFTAGYFYREKSNEFIENKISFILVVLLSSSINSFFYSVLGAQEIKLSFISLFVENAIFPGIYTSIIAFGIILIPRKRINAG